MHSHLDFFFGAGVAVGVWTSAGLLWTAAGRSGALGMFVFAVMRFRDRFEGRQCQIAIAENAMRSSAATAATANRGLFLVPAANCHPGQFPPAIKGAGRE